MRNLWKPITAAVCVSACCLLGGCSLLDNAASFLDRASAEYAKDKEVCTVDTEDFTRFTYRGREYAILEDTLSPDDLGDWTGTVRKIVAADEDRKVLGQEDASVSSLTRLTELAEQYSDAAYVVSFLNVYEKNGELSIDADGAVHQAVPVSSLTDSHRLWVPREAAELPSRDFAVNEEDCTQLACGDILYQITEEAVSGDRLGDSLDFLAEQRVYETDTKKALSRQELSEIDWDGGDASSRERVSWTYGEVRKITDRDPGEAVAVQICGEYRTAERVS